MQTRKNLMDLPTEVLMCLMQHVFVGDIENLSLTSKEVRNLCRHCPEVKLRLLRNFIIDNRVAHKCGVFSNIRISRKGPLYCQLGGFRQSADSYEEWRDESDLDDYFKEVGSAEYKYDDLPQALDSTKWGRWEDQCTEFFEIEDVKLTNQIVVTLKKPLNSDATRLFSYRSKCIEQFLIEHYPVLRRKLKFHCDLLADHSWHCLSEWLFIDDYDLISKLAKHSCCSVETET